MQRKLIAFAVAGLTSAPAFSQSNVTIYGVVDVAVGIGSAGDNDFRGLTTAAWNGNRFGFKGTEDLGNGLKAVFQLEQGFNVDTGEANSTRQFHRQSWVGLQGAFGTVGLGRQYAPGYFAIYDAGLGGLASPWTNIVSGTGMTIVPGSIARWDNSLAYTGTFKGLTVRGTYSMNSKEADADPQQDDKWGVGAEYKNGPLKAGAAFHYLKESSDDQKELLIGAEYDFGVLTLAGSWQAGRDVGAGDVAKRFWSLGVIVPVSAAGKVHVSYGVLKEKDVDEADAKSWLLAYRHDLSKRTNAYVAYNRTTNDDAVQYGMVKAPAGVTGKDSGLFMVGMRHNF